MTAPYRGERANYITCPKGHKVFVIWSEDRERFAFTCDECDQHSEIAFSFMTGHVVKVKILRRLTDKELSQI